MDTQETNIALCRWYATSDSALEDVHKRVDKAATMARFNAAVLAQAADTDRLTPYVANTGTLGQSWTGSPEWWNSRGQFNVTRRTRPHGKAVNITTYTPDTDADRMLDKLLQRQVRQQMAMMNARTPKLLPPKRGMLADNALVASTPPTRWYHRLWAYFAGDDISY